MRLLQRSDSGEYSLTRAFVSDEETPPYAILSHTWLEDAQEPTFEDLKNGTGGEKLGYEKIRFCAEQANRDGLQYFWVDTCCINKSNSAELSQAVNSMFRWYRNATRCYVYLLDVTGGCGCINDDLHSQWDSDLGRSRWFTRGWTLQELLAPRSIEFFSYERIRIGDRSSLKQQIQQITGVPTSALQGARLSQFSVDERFLWMERRQTKLVEDKVYSLLGILDVEIPLYYGEGAGNAYKRVQEVINKRERCTQDLRLTDPCDDKKRIEDTKGGLLKDSYCWIFENSDFQQWRDNQQSRLLWIRGDPGKGKTMLLCGIIDELNKSMDKTALLSYFFCQATDSRINSATAVLRGLLFLLVKQQPSLISHMRKKYDHAGRTLFEDTNAWVALCEIFTDIVQDPSLNSLYLIIDALDECVTDLPKLLDLVVQTSSSSSCVKWVVSSRNWPNIEERLERVGGGKVRLSLELNAESVSAAVRSYIRHKVSQLAQDKKYNDKIKDAVLNYLYSNANDTFLWVALACQNLEKMSRLNVVTKLRAFPPGLNALYERMMQYINNSDDADTCRRILALITVVYRPITLQELTSLAEECEDMAEDLEAVREVVSLCGSLLTIRDGIIYFVHQSAKDFLLKEASDIIFPSGREEVHYALFSRSLLAMSNTLRRDMYSLEMLGYSIDQVTPPNPDPLVALYYSCIYWIDHLYDSKPGHLVHSVNSFHGGDDVNSFLREKYLYWLEALSLCKSISKGVVSMAKLEALTNERAAVSLMEVVQDARQFIMYHEPVIESSPLQVYASALLFSPTRSLIRVFFKEEEPKAIVIKPGMQDKWGSRLSTFEGLSSYVNSVAFSHDSAWLASGLGNSTVKVWDARSGECLSTLEGHSSYVSSVTFSHDSTRLASGSGDSTVKVWDARSGECLSTLEGHSSYVKSVAFSHDSTRLASGSGDNTVKVWDAHSSECLSTLKGHSSDVRSVAFSHDSTWLASGSYDNTVKVWDAHSGECLLTLEGHSSYVSSVTFSYNLTQLASGSYDSTVKLWDTRSGECLSTLEGHSSYVSSVAFSYNSTWLASGSYDSTVKVWDARSGECLSTLESHSSYVSSVTFSHDSTRLASGSVDSTVKVWDAHSGECLSTLKSHNSDVRSVAFSHNSTRLASGSGDSMVKVWDTHSGGCLLMLEGHSSYVSSVAFSHDSTQLASGSGDSTVKVWDARSGECLSTLEGHSSYVSSVAFSHDSARLASGSGDSTVKVWDARSGECLSTLESHSSYVSSVAFSHDSARLASGSYDNTVKVWDAHSGECLSTLEGHSSYVSSVAFSHDSTRLASGSDDNTVKVWDARSGDCLLVLEVGKTLYSILFDIGDSYLQTDTGVINISAIPSSRPISTGAKPQIPQYHGLAINAGGVWITYNSDNVVWLPSEYRPSCSAVLGDIIAIGVGSGRVWICEVQPNNSLGGREY